MFFPSALLFAGAFDMLNDFQALYPGKRPGCIVKKADYSYRKQTLLLVMLYVACATCIVKHLGIPDIQGDQDSLVAMQTSE